MSEAQKSKGTVFRDLHSGDGIFVMPNAWNAGSACMLEAAGFPAVGTTSAGISFCLGLPDYEGVLTREAALEETVRIAGAIRIPGQRGRGERLRAYPGRGGRDHPPGGGHRCGRGKHRRLFRRPWHRRPLRSGAVGGENRGGGGGGCFPAVSIYPDRESRGFSLGSPEPIRGIRGPGRFLSGRGGGTASMCPESPTRGPSARW